MKLLWEQRALGDLRRIQLYIARDDPRAAARWVAKLIERAEAVVTLPYAGRKVPEIERDDVREVFLKQYRIIYRVADASVHVLTLFEGHRQMPRDLDDEAEPTS